MNAILTELVEHGLMVEAIRVEVDPCDGAAVFRMAEHGPPLFVVWPRVVN